MTKYEQRIKSLEALGLNTSDAQGVFMCEIMQLALYISKNIETDRDHIENLISQFYEAPVDKIRLQFELLRTDLVDTNLELSKLKQAVKEVINMSETHEEVRAVLDRALTGYVGRPYDPKY